jgi:hypothetical protein
MRWEKISDGIPKSILSFAHVVREDPVRPGMLYVGTDNAVYYSLDDGGNWTQLQSGLPPAPVYWLTIQEPSHDLVIATYGRGFYILDNIGPIRESTAEVLSSTVHLFEPRPAYRFHPIASGRNEPNGMSSGRNPPYGADINYSLGAAEAPVKVEILDGRGAVVQTLNDPPGRVGLNRVWWNLRHEDPRRAQLRVAPPGKPFVTLEDGWRPLRTWDLDLNGGQRGPLAVPGAYTVRLTVGDEVQEQPLTVLKDPYSSGTVSDIRSQVTRTLEMRDELNEIVDMIDEVEWLRKQLEDLQARFDGDTAAARVISAAQELEQKAMSVEGNLFDIHMTGAREDAFRTPMKLYGRLSALASDLNRNGADFPATTQQIEVHTQFKAQLAEYKELYLQLMTSDRAEFRRLLRELGIPDIISAELPKENP